MKKDMYVSEKEKKKNVKKMKREEKKIRMIKENVDYISDEKESMEKMLRNEKKKR
jgi:hypothetical protein